MRMMNDVQILKQCTYAGVSLFLREMEGDGGRFLLHLDCFEKRGKR